jgi:glycosyltransferase involved in cell wall biosynthesis
MPKLSVVLNVDDNYNERTDAAVRSVLSQRFVGDMEMIVVDRGRTQKATELIDQTRAPRRRFFTQPYLKPIDALNFGISQAKSKYVAFVHNNGLWLPDKTAWQIAYLDEHEKTDIVVGTTYLFEGQSVKPSALEEPVKGEALNMLIFGAAIVRLEAFETVGPVCESADSAAEVDWCLRASENHSGLSLQNRPALLLHTSGAPHLEGVSKLEALYFDSETQAPIEAIKSAPVAAAIK